MYFHVTYIQCVQFVQIHVYENANFYVQHYTSVFPSLEALTGSCEYFSKPCGCFYCLQCLCVSIGCLGVWGELVNCEKFLTHRPSSQGWAPRHPTHFVIAFYRFVVVTLGLGSLLSLELLAM